MLRGETEARAFCSCPPRPLSSQRKVAVLYCRAGQGSEEEMVSLGQEFVKPGDLRIEELVLGPTPQ